MAPKKQKSQAEPPPKPEASRSDSTGWDASQEQSSTKMFDMMSKTNDKVKVRRDARKKAIIISQNARTTKLRADVDHAAQQYDEEVRAVRRPGVEHLLELAQKKREIEARITKCQSELEQAYFSAAKQLQVALDGRADELEV